MHSYGFWAAVPFLIAAELHTRETRFAFPAFQPSIATGGALFTRRESSEGDLRGCASRLDLSNHVSVILSPRPKRSGCAQGGRLQVGNSISASHSCSERNGVIADAAYPADSTRAELL